MLTTPRLTHNAHADRASVSKAGIADPAFHPSLPHFATTPLRPAPKAAQRLGVRSVLVKDESQRLGMPSFKILGASWATYRTIMAHLGQPVGAQPTLDKLREAVAADGPDLTLVAATDGNHGRAVARMAKLLNLDAIILVPAGTVSSRIDAIAAEGAQVRVVSGGYDQAIAASAAISDDTHVVISDTSWEGYTDTPGWVIDGYSTMLTEIVDEIEAGHVAEPTVVATPMGVGAFGAAVTRAFASRPARLLVGVEPTRADCIITSVEAGKITTISEPQDSIMAGLNCATPSIVAWDDVLAGYDVFVTVTDDHARDAMRLLHDDGIEAGESGAAGLAGLLAHAEGLGLGPQDDVIVFATEGITDPVAYREIIGIGVAAHTKESPMQALELERDVVDASVYDNTVARFREAGIALPTFAQLADPSLIPAKVREALAGVGPDDAHPLNLFRVNWYNDDSRRGFAAVPAHVVLPKSLTGVDARIVVAFGNRFPMIGAHKVLAAYGCLVPRIITGQFDPTRHRAIWPSTGNYCRGGVAISAIMNCRGVAVLPEGMSRERFAWLEDWVADPSDIIRTPGTESNVKEIYDRCKELAKDPENVIFNQFSEFGNYISHYLATGSALLNVYNSMLEEEPGLRLRAFVSATGSAGTIAAGDYLKEHAGSLTVAVEALECATMLRNGFGEHNIQGIGDKHIPFIHNVMATDMVVAVSDRATDRLGVMFNSDVGRTYLGGRQDVPREAMDALASMGLSSIANVLAAIKTAKYYDLGPDDVIVTVATDGAAMYGSERDLAMDKYFAGGFDEVAAGEVFGEHLLGATTDHLLELSHQDRERIFNLGYFTWVEQQGMSIEEFRIRKDPRFWADLPKIAGDWDRMIDEFNGQTGALDAV